MKQVKFPIDFSKSQDLSIPVYAIKPIASVIAMLIVGGIIFGRATA